jgi:hypothetical protein
MAEIPIQHKPGSHRSSALPWIVAVLVLVLAVIGYAAYRNHNAAIASADTSSAAGEVQNTFSPPAVPSAEPNPFDTTRSLIDTTHRADSTLPISPFDTTTPMRRGKPATTKSSTKKH